MRAGLSVPFLSFSFVFLFVLSGCTEPEANAVSLSGLTMGTTWSVEIAGAKADRQQLNHDINAILDDINGKMSTYLPDSELSRLNQATDREWKPLSKDLYRVITEALHITHETGGAFDITIGPVVNLWGFGPEKHTTIPTDADIAATLNKTGIDKIELRSSPPALKKFDPGVYLDLSAIAKGYAVDRIAGYLEQARFKNYMVEIGGEIRARGKNAQGNAWRIGIEKPVADQRTVERIIHLNNFSMATSGDYRNYFEQDSVRYSHTIDPRTGRPITHKLASVSVLHASAMTADALATGLLVLGPEKGFELAQQRGLAAFFIIKNDNGFADTYTDAFNAFLLKK